jgi:ABC-type branched-subunit amino acid transport system substrate-binding protein
MIRLATLLLGWTLAAGAAEPPPPALAAPDVALRVRDALAAGDTAAARALLPELRAATPAPPDAERLARAVEGAAVTRRRIGVLLPLSGRLGTVGRQLEQAVRAGWDAAGAPGELVVVDSGGDAATAVAAFDALVAQQGAVAVVGTVLGAEADAVARAAEAVGVPFVALAQGMAPSPGRRFVRQGVVTVHDQVDALLDHVMGAQGRKRFAIVAPDSEYGRTAADAFAAEVAARGGTVAVRAAYPADAKDFRGVAKQVARRRSADAEPIVDYDAVFLPDTARRVPLVAAALAFEEIPVGHFRPHDTPSVPLLGLSAWDGYELLPGGGIYTQDGLFTDVFVPPPDTAHLWTPLEPWRPFVDDYRERTRRTPSGAEALAWDVAQVLAQVRRADPATRAAFRDALDAVRPEPGVTGVGPVDPASGAIPHRIRIVSVRKDGFVPVDAE